MLQVPLVRHRSFCI